MKQSSLVLKTVSIAAATLVLAGCGTGQHATSANSVSNLATRNDVSGNQSSPVSTSNQVTGQATANQTSANQTNSNQAGNASSGLPSQPTLLNVTQRQKLSLRLPNNSNQGTFDVTCAPDFINSQQGFAVGPEGLLYTPDGGTTWHHLVAPAGQIMDLHFTSATSGWLITSVGDNSVGTKNTLTIYHTSDAGAHWQKQWSGSVQGGVAGPRMFSFDGTAYAVVAGRLLKLGPNGSSWSVITLPEQGSVGDAEFITDQLGYAVVEETQKPQSPGDGPTTKLVVQQTTDGGLHWHAQLTTPSFQGNVVGIAFGSTNDGVLLYKDLARMQTVVYRTSNGGKSWSRSVPQALEGRIMAGRPVFAGDGSIWISMSAGAAPFASFIAASNDLGQTWHTVVQHGEWRDFTISHRFGNTAYVMAGLDQGYALLKTTDGGKRWSQQLPSYAPTRSISFISPLIGYALGTNSNQNAILKTTDGGRTWDMVGSVSTGGQVENITFSSENRGYATVAPMKVSGQAGNTMVMETSDGGRSWSPATFGAAPQSILDKMSKGTAIVDPVYFLPPNSPSSQNWVIGATGYPKLYAFESGGSGTKVEATYDDPPGAIENYSFLSATDGWMSVLRTAKSGSTNGQTTLYELDGKQGKWLPKWTLPNGWSVEGMYRLSKQDAWLVAQDPWTSLHPTFAVFRTEDGGQTWTRYELQGTSQVATPATYGSSSFPIDFVNPNDGWLLTGQGLLKTTDGGASWSPADQFRALQRSDGAALVGS